MNLLKTTRIKEEKEVIKDAKPNKGPNLYLALRQPHIKEKTVI